MNTTNKVLIAIAVGGGAYLAYNYYQNEQAKKIIGTGTGITENSRAKIEADIVKQYVEVNTQKNGYIDLVRLEKFKKGLASFTMSDLEQFNLAWEYNIKSINVENPTYGSANAQIYNDLKNSYILRLSSLSENGKAIVNTMDIK